MVIFDWNTIRAKYNDKQPTREAVIRAAFQQWVDGNSCFADANSLEMGAFYDVFKASWLICEETMRVD